MMIQVRARDVIGPEIPFDLVFNTLDIAWATRHDSGSGTVKMKTGAAFIVMDADTDTDNDGEKPIDRVIRIYNTQL